MKAALFTAMQVLVLSLLLFVLASPAKEQEKSEPFAETLSRATVAVYQGEQVCKWNEEDDLLGPDWHWGCSFKAQFICTATVIERRYENEYVGLTSGHCFLSNSRKKYYIADVVNDAPVLHKITLIKSDFSDRYDYALFSFTALREHPVIEVDLSSYESPAIGLSILNVNFSLGVTKQILEGKVVSGLITTGKRIRDRYFVSIGVGPGASGSAIVSAETHKIVGVTEFIIPETQMATGIIPTGQRFVDFMEDDSAGLKEQSEVGKPPEKPAEHVLTMRESIHGLWVAFCRWLPRTLLLCIAVGALFLALLGLLFRAYGILYITNILRRVLLRLLGREA